MKNLFSAILLSVLVFALSACGKVQTPVKTPPPSVPAEAGANEAQVDVDLTLLSSTMVYSEVYNMVYEPESYEGKIVKMKGLFSAYETDGKRYLACVVPDATACCAQGLEFELKDDAASLPEPGSAITVIGSFTSYKEEIEGNSYIYLILKDAELL